MYLVCDHPSLIGEELLSGFIHEDERLDPEDDDYKCVLNPINQSRDNLSTVTPPEMKN